MSTSVTSGTVTGDRMIHEGGRDVTYDLTGVHSEFLKSSEYVHFTQEDQIIELPVPAYVVVPSATAYTSNRQGIRIYLMDETVEPGAASAVLEELEFVDSVPVGGLSSRQWTYEEEDVTAKSKALLLWNRVESSFDGILARKIRVYLNEGVANARIRIDYQAFYKDLIDVAQFKGERGPVYSRELGQFMLDKLDDLDARTRIITRNMFGNTSRVNDILLEDLTAQSADNRVTTEFHEVSTSTGETLMAPALGSFYPGVPGSSTAFEMFKLFCVEEEVTARTIREGSRNGWLFIYNTNMLRTYVAVEPSGRFNDREVYYVTNARGDHRKLTMGSSRDVEERKADYYNGMDFADFKGYVCQNGGYFEDRVVYYVIDATGAYVETSDYTVGEPIPPGKYYIYTETQVETAKTVPSSDPQRNFMAAVNDTTAVISKEHRVVLTVENIGDYLGVYGTMVDIGLQHPDSSKLELGVDYEFCDVNLAKTEKTYSDQAVYDHVRFISTVETGDTLRLAINYQAFGGQITPADVRNIRQDLTNAMTILGEHQLLTVENLEKQPLLKELFSRVRRMESYHHHFAQVDHQVYKGMKGFHWINIATLYDLQWLEELGDKPLKEIGTFRVSSRDQRWCYEFTVSVDLSKNEANCLSLKTNGANGTELNTLENWVSLRNKERLGVRLCWNDDGKSSGAVLQLGWDFDNYNYDADAAETKWDNDTITVTNKSGHTSLFKLYSNPLEVTLDTDASINVYGHVIYIPYQGIIQAHTPYYKQLTEYLYYLTGAVYTKSGVTYYTKNEITGTYEEATGVRPNQKVSDYGNLYEREAYRTLYQRATVSVGSTVVYGDGIFVVDDGDSFADSSFTFINQTELWDHIDHPVKSKCSTVYIDDGSGLTVWMGNYPLKPWSFGPNKGIVPITLHSCLTEEDQNVFNANTIKQAVVLFYDRKVGRYFSATIDMCSAGSTGQSSFGDGFFFMEDLCGMSLRVYDSERSRYTYGKTSDTLIQEGKTYYTRSGDGTTVPYTYKAIPRFVLTSRYFASGQYFRLYKNVTADSYFSTGKDYYKYNSSTKKYILLVEGTDYTVGTGIAVWKAAHSGTEVYDPKDMYESVTVASASEYSTKRTTYGGLYAWHIGFQIASLADPNLYLVTTNPVYDIDLEVGMGTSSWINDRFDMRQVKLFF